MRSLKIALAIILVLIAAKFVNAAESMGGVGTGGYLPSPGNAGYMIVDNGTVYVDAVISGDICSSSVTAGLLNICGQENLPNSGSGLSSSIAGQYRVTDGSGHMVVTTENYPVPFYVNTPTGGTTYYLSIPWALNFNTNFASSTGVSAATGGCGTAPSETDTWKIYCNQSGTETEIGTFAFGTSCTATSNPPTFATEGSPSPQSCSAGMYEFVSPATSSGQGLAVTFVGHN
jgi:hypothetical protein